MERSGQCHLFDGYPGQGAGVEQLEYSHIIFGSGYVTLGHWWKVGLVMSIVNTVIWVLVGSVWWKVLGHW